ncbi:PaaI family thioesterase [Adhaeribacter arboris]|uniref:Medium/long-chain acyl-CoA thioesterase YigI n=1 Tax=Adhaeribacter arboris TaxID=2072846 RepID=A0A2T2YBP0_9BACT|nr:PaaI family thioesterase [Adhaeribacter arboris]PSR52906.1 PaaI family thioesterase [Adhaeribacter arboris]
MIKTLNPNFQNTINERLRNQNFMALVGFEITKIAEGLVEGELLLTSKHQQHRGFVHGGVTATLADITAGLAAVSLVPADHHVVTADLKISYLNPGVGEKLFARGWVLKQGRKLNFCEAEVFCHDYNKPAVLIAKASAIMVTITPDELEINSEKLEIKS